MQRQILLNGQSVRYTLSRKQVKNTNLRIRNGELFISASKTVPLSIIEDFMQRKASWILSALAKTQQTTPVSEHTAYLCGEQVMLPSDINREQWQKEQAAQLLPLAFEKAWELFQSDGFAKPALRLRKMKSRWGSCIPSKSVITLNTALVGAPVECQVAVAAHELCHMLQPNHSKAFYTALFQHFPNYSHCQQTLKLTQTSLINS